jgi:IS5 family transposase
LIVKYKVTDASVHDSQVIEELLEPSDKGQPLWVDSAYSGEPIANAIKTKKMKNRIHEKGTKNNPLNQKQIENNTGKSRVRV